MRRFSGTVDMLEDIMQASVPTFIVRLDCFFHYNPLGLPPRKHSVRIPDLGLGANPIRITAIRALPDADLDPVTSALSEEDRESIKGEHVNWELSFAYRATPNRTRWSEKAENFQ